MPEDSAPAFAAVARAENALIAKAAAEGVVFVQLISAATGVSTKDREPPAGPFAGGLSAETRSLHAALGGGSVYGTLVVELESHGGAYRLRHTFELEEVSPARLVLDAHYRQPNDPAPGMPRPYGIEVMDRPTDPAVLEEVRALVREFTERYAVLVGAAPEPGPGLSEAEVLAAETALGFRLPEEVRALYRTVAEPDSVSGLLGAQTLFPLDRVVDMYRRGGPGVSLGPRSPFPVNPVVFDAEPPDRVRRLRRDDWWLTIGTDFEGDSCAIDLDPGPAGRRGQLFTYRRNHHDRAGYVADSVTTVLRQVVASLRAGERPSGIGRPVPRSRYASSHELGSRTVAEFAAGLAEPERFQELRLTGGGYVDVSGMAGLPRLRALSVDVAGTLAGRFREGLPVESLRLGGERIEVTGWGALHELWHVKMSGGLPSVAALREAPGLRVLDLSAVTGEVADLELLSVFPALRVLTLNSAQWRRLRDAGAIPRGLAAAELTGRTRLDDALDWRRVLAA